MLKNTQAVFLAGIVAMSVIISPLDVSLASAAIVSDQDISNQQMEVRRASRTAIEEYTRLLLYVIIFRLETQINTQSK